MPVGYELNTTKQISHSLNEVSGGEDGEGFDARLEVFCVKCGEELAVVLDGGGEDGQVLWIGGTEEGIDFLLAGIGKDFEAAADEHAEAGEGGWKFLLEVALNFGDDLLAGDGFDEGDFCHAQDDLAGAVLIGGSRPGEENVGIYENARLFRFTFHISLSCIFHVARVSLPGVLPC